MKDLTLIEEMVLWAVWQLEDNAYGVTIRKRLSDTTQRIFPYGTLYGTLAKLARRDFITKIAGDPSPVRGGRSKNYYVITQKGIEALKSALELKKLLWNKESELNLSKN